MRGGRSLAIRPPAPFVITFDLEDRYAFPVPCPGPARDRGRCAVGAKPSSSRAKSAAAASPSAPVNLNTATQAQLETLPGIGAGAAQRILEYRQKNAGFKKVEDLMNVKGIGEKSFLKLKPLITVTTEKGERAGGTR